MTLLRHQLLPAIFVPSCAAIDTRSTQKQTAHSKINLNPINTNRFAKTKTQQKIKQSVID